MVMAPHIRAENWTPRLSLAGTLTLSDNVFLRPAGRESGDLIALVTPSIGLNGKGGRLTLDFRYAPTVVKYLDNASSDTIRQDLNASATLEAVEKFLYFDARAAIFQSVFNPLGARPSDQTSISANRTEQAIVGFSPYIQHRTSSGSQYALRNDSYYSTLLSSTQSGPVGQAGGFTNRFTANYNGPPGTFVVFSADYFNGYTESASLPPANLQVARGRLTVPFDPQTSVFLIGGYETNDLVFGGYEGPIYGGGATWGPTPRTSISALAEKRFFGNSYNVTFNHRTRATSWALRASNSVQQFGSSGIGYSTQSTRDLLDNLFLSAIPDPIARQQAVDQYISQNGLPATVTTPTNFYSNRITQIESIYATFGLIGVRNSIIFGVFYALTNPVNVAVNTGVPDVFNTYSTVTQRGASVNFSHRISGLVTLGGGIDRINSKGSGVGALGVPITPTDTNQTIVRGNLTKQFSPKTFGTATLRYQTFDSNTSTNYVERAVLLTVTHAFY